MISSIFGMHSDAVMKRRPWLLGAAAVCALSIVAALRVWNHANDEASPSDQLAASLAELPAAGGAKLSDFYQPNLCGPASLYAICRGRGIETNLAELAELAGTDRRGTSVYGIIQAAIAKGLNSQAYEANLNHLQRVKGPAIIDFPAGHFCVLHSWRNGEALLIDPPSPNRLVPASALEAFWGKHVIIFE